MSESLCCTPEPKTLKINYTSIRYIKKNKFKAGFFFFFFFFQKWDPVFQNDLILVSKSWTLGAIRVSSLCSLRRHVRNLLSWKVLISTMEGNAGEKTVLVCSGGRVGWGPAVFRGSSLTVIPVTP